MVEYPQNCIINFNYLPPLAENWKTCISLKLSGLACSKWCLCPCFHGQGVQWWKEQGKITNTDPKTCLPFYRHACHGVHNAPVKLLIIRLKQSSIQGVFEHTLSTSNWFRLLYSSHSLSPCIEQNHGHGQPPAKLQNYRPYLEPIDHGSLLI